MKQIILMGIQVPDHLPSMQTLPDRFSVYSVPWATFTQQI